MAWKISDKVPADICPIYMEALDRGGTWIVVAENSVHSPDIELTENKRYRVEEVYFSTDEELPRQEEVTDINFKLRDDRMKETFANIDDFREYWNIVYRKAVLVDDNPEGYDTMQAMGIATKRLAERYNVRWGIDVVDQKKALDIVNAIRPDAVIIDNDSGKGLVTINEVIGRTPGALPLGYVTAHNREQLARFRECLDERACAEGGIASLEQMDERGVKLMRKRGKTASQSQLLCNQATDMYMFLGPLVGDRWRHNEWDDAPVES